jgi:uncharacterized protein
MLTPFCQFFDNLFIYLILSLSVGDPMNIRTAQESDLASIVEINNQHATYLGRKEKSFFRHRMTTDTLLVAEEEHVQGFVLLMDERAQYPSPHFQWFKERYDRFHYVDRIAVDTSSQRTGVGSALYGLLRELRATGAVLCEIDEQNTSSIAFHERHLFRRVGAHTVNDHEYGMYSCGR